MTEFACEPLGKLHQRDAFDCGISVLNHYLSKVASQDVKRKAAAVFVLTPTAEPRRVAGYYTLCSTSIELSALPPNLVKRLPRYPHVPAILIGRLARDIGFPGVGSLLLSDAIARSARVAVEVAATVIVVDSKNEAAKRFYAKYGFISLPQLETRMFLPLATIEKL